MELLASGLNAWGQLDFANSSTQKIIDPHDNPAFKCVLRGSSIEHVQAYLSYTNLILNGVKRTAGHCPRRDRAIQEQQQQPEAYPSLASASNGSAAIIDQSGTVIQFNSLHDLGQCVPNLPTCSQLVAYDIGFAALTTTGRVYTWGDERYGACLGRELCDECPAEKPGLVIALQDLPTGPIAKIAAGGYMLAALTTGNDLYLWGGHPGRKTVPVDVSDEPTPIVINELDIADVAVGEAHLIVLTSEGTVFVIGDNGNGQLGLPIESTDTWRQVDLNLKEGSRAIAVAAGPRNSFVIIEGG